MRLSQLLMKRKLLIWIGVWDRVRNWVSPSACVRDLPKLRQGENRTQMIYN